MNIMEDLVLNLILVVFPILVYFIYNCYRELCMEKYNNLLFGLALTTSLYLSFKYGNIVDNYMMLLFCNLPIVVAYLKKQANVGMLLSVIVVFYSYFVFKINVIIMSINLISYFVIYVISENKKVKDNTFILVIAVLQGFFLSFEYFYLFPNSQLLSVFELLFLGLLFYVLPFVLLYLFKLTDRVTSLFLTVSELERDKQLKNSLFKITHEVKNPIAVCKGYLDMLNIDNRDHLERYIPIIRQELSRSLNIMSDFMEFSKIKIEKEFIDINLLLENIDEEMKILLKGKNIDFSCRLIQDEIFINGDYNRLKQVFINLIKNSMESIDGKGKIIINTHMLKGYYYIEIEDNGCGMDEDTLKNVMEMFFTTKVKGSGLGVSLSNEIIKAHQGRIDYFSKVGKGTKVVVKLPIIVL